MENLQQTTTLWSTTAPEVRYLSYIDHIGQESCECVLAIAPGLVVGKVDLLVLV